MALVCAFLSSGCTGKSSIETNPPKQFSIIAANPTAPLQAEISWQTSNGASSYKVMYGTSSGVYSNVVSETATSPFVVTGLSDGVTYYFKVEAANLAGTQPALNEISTTVYATLSVASIAPAEGFFAGGQTVTLTGTGFQPGTTIKIAGSNCTSVNIVNASTLTCKTPNHALAESTNVTITDSAARTINLTNGYTYKSDAFQKLELFAGSNSSSGHKNAVGTAAKFFRPTKPVVYNGYAYITDTNNHMIRRMNLTSRLVEDVAGQAFLSGTTDGIGSAARFFHPMGMTLVGSDLYIADSGNCLIRKLNTTTNAVTTIAGQGSPCAPLDNADGSLAGFGTIHALTNDGGGNLYVADDSGTIAKVSLTPPYSSAALSIATDVLLDIVYLNNVLYYTVSTGTYFWVMKIDLAVMPLAETLIAGGNSTTDVDGVGSAARFNAMGGIETDGTDLFVSSTQANKIKRITVATKTVTTILGNGTNSEVDGIGTAATLAKPAGLFYLSGDLYIASLGGSGTLRKYNVSTNTLTTLAGGGQ